MLVSCPPPLLFITLKSTENCGLVGQTESVTVLQDYLCCLMLLISKKIGLNLDSFIALNTAQAQDVAAIL